MNAQINVQEVMKWQLSTKIIELKISTTIHLSVTDVKRKYNSKKDTVIAILIKKIIIKLVPIKKPEVCFSRS